MRFAIHGATGRMGLTLVRISRGIADLELVGGACAPGDPAAGRDLGELAGIGSIGVMAAPDVGSALLGADVVIDFSTASAVPALLASAAQQKVAVVSGTTALDENAQRAIDKAATSVAVLWAPNTSIGVQVLSELVEQAVRKLGSAFDVEIVETHHRKKVDAPSGTARRLADAAKAGRPELSELNTREGIVGPRTDEEIGVMALRGGDVIGDHTVFLFGSGERIELTHRATSRDLFAQGALRAARLLMGKPAGRYTLADVLRS
jgi:4-hydroxy-tetrahydrodipicolinate reductase